MFQHITSRTLLIALFFLVSIALSTNSTLYAQAPAGAGQVIISEFRLSGPNASGTGSARDEFIELYNTTDTPLSIGGYLIFAYDPNFNGPGSGADFVQALPNNVVIPARGHYLIGDSGAYSLGGYATLNFDTAPIFSGDFFVDNEGILLADDAAEVILDSVGFSGSGGRSGEGISYNEGTPLTRRTQTPPTVQYSYVRRYDTATGRPIDTNNNASDFVLTSVTGAALPATAGGTVPVVLGAPGPQNLASPTSKTNSQITPSLVEPTQPHSASPNRVRDVTVVPNGPSGTLSIRRQFTNNTGAPVTRLRFRIIDITTLGTPNPGGAQADLRAITSGDITIPVTSVGVTTVQGTTLEQPPAQPNGGGFNSTLSAGTITTGTPLANGSTISVNFLLGVQQAGAFRFLVVLEALP